MKRYRVQYWLGNGTHNSMYYEDFDEARVRYVKWLMEQTLETKLVRCVRMSVLGKDDDYHTIFEARVYHPIEIY